MRLFKTFLVLSMAVILSGCIALPVRYTGYHSYRVYDQPASTAYHHGVTSVVPHTYGRHYTSHHNHVVRRKVVHKKVVVYKPQKVILKKKVYKKRAYKGKIYKKKSSKRKRVLKKTRRR